MVVQLCRIRLENLSANHASNSQEEKKEGLPGGSLPPEKKKGEKGAADRFLWAHTSGSRVQGKEKEGPAVLWLEGGKGEGRIPSAQIGKTRFGDPPPENKASMAGGQRGHTLRARRPRCFWTK